MSEIPKHLREILVKAAKKQAFLSKHREDYLPETKHEMRQFTPHEWVIEAMYLAYTKGIIESLPNRYK